MTTCTFHDVILFLELRHEVDVLKQKIEFQNIEIMNLVSKVVCLEHHHFSQPPPPLLLSPPAVVSPPLSLPPPPLLSSPPTVAPPPSLQTPSLMSLPQPLVHPDTVVNKYNKLVTPSKIGQLAVRLADEAYFGKDILIKSTVF